MTGEGNEKLKAYALTLADRFSILEPVYEIHVPNGVPEDGSRLKMVVCLFPPVATRLTNQFLLYWKAFEFEGKMTEKIDVAIRFNLVCQLLNLRPEILREEGLPLPSLFMFYHEWHQHGDLLTMVHDGPQLMHIYDPEKKEFHT